METGLLSWSKSWQRSHNVVFVISSDHHRC